MTISIDKTKIEKADWRGGQQVITATLTSDDPADLGTLKDLQFIGFGPLHEKDGKMVSPKMTNVVKQIVFGLSRKLTVIFRNPYRVGPVGTWGLYDLDVVWQNGSTKISNSCILYLPDGADVVISAGDEGGYWFTYIGFDRTDVDHNPGYRPYNGLIKMTSDRTVTISWDEDQGTPDPEIPDLLSGSFTDVVFHNGIVGNYWYPSTLKFIVPDWPHAPQTTHWGLRITQNVSEGSPVVTDFIPYLSLTGGMLNDWFIGSGPCVGVWIENAHALPDYGLGGTWELIDLGIDFVPETVP